jgi:hypothetical protein
MTCRREATSALNESAVWNGDMLLIKECVHNEICYLNYKLCTVDVVEVMSNCDKL